MLDVFEIVIVDGYSEDKTVEIARKYTDKIYQKEFSGSFAVRIGGEGSQFAKGSAIERFEKEWERVLSVQKNNTY